MPDEALAAERPLASDTIATLSNRVSVRAYTEEPVTGAQVDAVLKAAFRAPTSSNIQSYSVVVVRNPDTLAQLAVVTRGQQHVAKAPVFLAFCADMTRIDAALRGKGGNIERNNLETGLVTTIDAALVGMSAYLAADSIGLKGVMIGAVRNDAVATARILGLPKRVYCVFGMVLGWPAEAPPQKPRLAHESVVHYERYSRTRDGNAVDPAIAAYDAALRAHYERVGKPTAPDSWSSDMAKKFMPEPRQNLRAELAALGFDFL